SCGSKGLVMSLASKQHQPPLAKKGANRLKKVFHPRLMIDYAILLFFTVVLLTPILWLVLATFKTNQEILIDPSFFPSSLNTQGWRDAFTKTNLVGVFLNSFIISSSSTLSVLLVASMAAYPLARFTFFGKNFLTVFFSLGIIVPVTALIVPELYLMYTLRLHDTKIGLILLYTALFFPISFLILRAFFLSIPQSLEEAAIIDGASYWTLLARIVLPLSGPGLSTVAVLVFIWTWNEFLYSLLMMASERNRTVQVAIKFFTAQFDFNLPGMFAAVTLVMLVPIVVFLLLQEKVVSGLTAGATKQ
ncbi:MAG: carbohydrate ABC transporter permease, partial [Deinococcota bacterium]